MRRHSFRVLIGLLAAFAVPAMGRAQIVIPDINKDTIVRVPAPGGEPVGREQQTIRPAAGDQPQTRVPVQQQIAPDARCDRLSPALRRVTPGCQP
jgi:hypothetical protein